MSPASIELDIENSDALLAYLRAKSYVEDDEVPFIQVLAGGVSNKTVLVKRTSGDAWVVKQALPKLRVAADWFCSPDRIMREAEGMRSLYDLAPPGSITRMIALDPANLLLLMEAVPEPHVNWKSMLLCGEIVDDHFRQFGELLASIHSRSLLDSSLAAAFDDRGYFESLRLEPYYSYALSNVCDAHFLAVLIEQTRLRRFTLVHGDYSPKNVLIHNGKLVLLDHEVIHFGDPAFDIGFSLTHILSKANHLPDHRDSFLWMASQYWQTYIHSIGDTSWDPSLERFAVLHSLGCLMARVAGRSPLEYLSQAERNRQRKIVLKLANNVPSSIPELIFQFSAELKHDYD